MSRFSVFLRNRAKFVVVIVIIIKIIISNETCVKFCNCVITGVLVEWKFFLTASLIRTHTHIQVALFLIYLTNLVHMLTHTIY